MEKEECDVFWINDSQLQVIYKGKTKAMTAEEIYAQYRHVPSLINELNKLLKLRQTLPEDSFEELLRLDDSAKAFASYFPVFETGEETQRRTIPLEERRKIIEEIDMEIARIIDELDLVQSDDVISQLRNCCKLQKYMALQNEYNSKIMQEKNECPYDFIRTMEVYNGVVQKNGVCTSNAAAFQEILSRLGMTIECVVLESSQGEIHMANLVLLNGEYYFFDITEEGDLFKKQNLPPEEIVLCFAGLGSNEYCEFYKPLKIISQNIFEGAKKVPENIAEERIPEMVIEMMIESESRKN